MNHSKKQFCLRGHDKEIVGRTLGRQCKACNKQAGISWGIINKTKRNKISKAWRKRNRTKVASYQTTYTSKRYADDTQFKLKARLRTRLWKSIRRDKKIGSAVKDLGCSIEFLKQYIQDKFYDNMTWENWGKVWQLDHIKPLASFDLTNPIQFKQAVHYTNLQPLIIKDHRKKTNQELQRI